jgi:uncharacterized UPF0160 family protein
MIKTTKIAEQATLVTHGGTFHSDEVLATVILSKVLGDVTVLRTFKVPEELDQEVIVYDIGFGKFDHHQKGGNGTRENGVPYASVGLIWKEFGRTLVENTCNPELVWNLIDRDLIQGVDATDNGTMPSADYPAQVMQLAQMISSFNPQWDSEEDSDYAFLKAVVFAEIVFDNTFATAVSKAKAQKIVDEAVEKSEGHIMVLNQFVPWQEFIFASNNEKAAEVQFVVFPSNRGGYNWQCVPNALGSFGQRKAVPTEWKGLRGTDLQKVTGVGTANFCHPAGFIGGAETFEDALALAKIAVEA